MLRPHLAIVLAQAERQRALEVLAHTDPLTGLANRRVFMEAAQRALQAQAGHPVMLAVLDVRGFKQINDAHGHDVGDQVLLALAQTLHTGLGALGQTFRLGGDEFAVLIPSTADHAAPQVHRLLRQCAGLSGAWGPGSLVIDVGLAAPELGDAPSDWLRRADQAMYGCKGRGGIGRSAGR